MKEQTRRGENTESPGPDRTRSWIKEEAPTGIKGQMKPWEPVSVGLATNQARRWSRLYLLYQSSSSS
jgi:hypothetical protein